MISTNGVVCVTGDVTLDCNIAQLPSPNSAIVPWNQQDRAKIVWERGGAALLADLVTAVLSKSAGDGWSVRAPQTALPPIQSPGFRETYSVWTPHPVRHGSKERVWRIDRFLGLGEASAPPQAPLVNDDGAGILVINDACMGYSEQPALWPRLLDKKQDLPRWIVLKSFRPDPSSPLWRDLLSRHEDRLIIVSNVDSLRELGTHVSRGISWERTLQDLLWAVNYRLFGEQALADKPAMPCAHAVVSLGAAGAMVFNSRAKRENGGAAATLIFDPRAVEGSWEDQHPGFSVGYLSCTAAAVVRALVEDWDTPNLTVAAHAATHAYRLLHRDGYGTLDEKSPVLPSRMSFPHAVIAQELANCWKKPQECGLASIELPEAAAAGTDRNWSLLRISAIGDLEKLAARIVIDGSGAALTGVPVGEFGKLQTADRREIESYRAIRNLLTEFVRRPGSKPVSVAVFGPPGSGKSFGVKAIANQIGQSNNQPLEIRTFNLSQFQSPEELSAALHQVRDIALSGRLPLIFWDEFDTTLAGVPLGWLRLFLEPMQDGTFFEGRISHPIGKAIFVFAGGTSNCLAEFNKGLADPAFRAAKGPDFVSRLRGYLDVLGPNPQDDNRLTDPFFVIRRAMLLRSMLEVNWPGILSGKRIEIDEGVLGAFLNVSHYRHGSRSMESIVLSSSLVGKTKFVRSSLPPLAQLELHVNGFEFQALVQQPDGLEQMARAIHDNYCDHLKKRGYRYAEQSDEKKCTSSSLVAFDQLPEKLKQENRAAAQAMPAKLAIGGYVMVPNRLGAGVNDFPPDALDRMAEAEHDRWVRSKLLAGWSWAPQRDDVAQKHTALLPWRTITPEQRQRLYPENPSAVGLDGLPESEKQKDRDQFQGLPAMLSQYGCSIVQLSPTQRD